MRRLSPLVGLGCLAGLVLACFGPVLFRGHQFGFRDAAHFYYPLHLRIQQEWRAGRLPLWSPEENSGMPLLGNPTAAVLYPGKLIFALAPDYPWGVRLYTLAHVALAVAAMYALARHWGQSRAAAAIAALSYAFGAPVLFQYCNVIFLVGAAWAPLGFRAADRWLRLGRRGAIGELAVVLAMQTLGGDPEATYVVGLCAGGYAIGLARSDRGRGRPVRHLAGWAVLGVLAWSSLVLLAAWKLPKYRVLRTPAEVLPWTPYVPATVVALWLAGAALLLIGPGRNRPGRAVLRRRLVGLGAAGALAGALAAVQLVPVLEYTGQTLRSSPDAPHEIYAFSVEPYRLAELVWPNVFGTTEGGNRDWLPTLPPWHESHVWVWSLYQGAIPLILALAAAGWRGGPPWRAWMTAVSGLSLLAAFGQFASPLWLARCSPIAAQVLGSHDPSGIGAIRPDGLLRDGDGSFYWLLATVLPGFGSFRYPAKLLTFATLGLAVLSGIGWDRLTTGGARRVLRVAATWVAITAGLGLAAGLARGPIVAYFASHRWAKGTSSFGPFDPLGAWSDLMRALAHGGIVFAAMMTLARLAPARPRMAAMLAVAVLSADLAIANARQVVTVPQSFFEGTPEVLARIEAAEKRDPTPGGLYRVHRLPTWSPIGWTMEPAPDLYADLVRWERRTIQPKYAIPFGLQYVFTVGTAELYDYEFFFAAFTRKPRDAEMARVLGVKPDDQIVTYFRRGFDLWNTRYFVIPDFHRYTDEYRGVASFLSQVETIAPKIADEGRRQEWIGREDWRILRNTAALPRAWAVHAARFADPIRGLRRADRVPLMLEMLYQDDPLWVEPHRPIYDPRQLAWIEAEPDDRAALARYAEGRPPGGQDRVTIARYEPQRVEIEADLAAPGLVILADVFYPGWELTLDGAPAPILRANRLMRGAAVPSGKHRLVYTYRPLSVKLGAVGTGLGLLALLGLSWRARRPGRA